MTMPSPCPARYKKKQKAYRAGLLAEMAAVLILFFKGYRVLKCRYKTHQGEVDILAQKGDVLVAVEVKARACFDTAIEAVNLNNQRRVEKAALSYYGRRKFNNYTLRFDIVAVRLWRGVLPISCKHLDNAWQSRT